MAAPKRIASRLADMRANPRNVRLADALVVARHYFEERPRGQNSSSHYSFKTPWMGDPRVNLQEGEDGRAKIYQVRQLLAAVEKHGE